MTGCTVRIYFHLVNDGIFICKWTGNTFLIARPNLVIPCPWQFCYCSHESSNTERALKMDWEMPQ
jgi:hypothetical protein